MSPFIILQWQNIKTNLNKLHYLSWKYYQSQKKKKIKPDCRNVLSKSCMSSYWNHIVTNAKSDIEIKNSTHDIKDLSMLMDVFQGLLSAVNISHKLNNENKPLCNSFLQQSFMRNRTNQIMLPKSKISCYLPN